MTGLAIGELTLAGIGLIIVIILALIYKYYSPLIYFFVVTIIVVLADYLLLEYNADYVQHIYVLLIITCPPNILVWGFPTWFLLLSIIRLPTVIKEFPSIIEKIKRVGLIKTIKVILILIFLFSGMIYYLVNPVLSAENSLIVILISVIVWYIGGNLLSRTANKGIEPKWKVQLELEKNRWKTKYHKFSQGEVDGLIDEATSEIERGNVEGWFMRGKIHFDLGNYEEAEQDFNKLITILTSSKELTNEHQAFLEKAYLAKGSMLRYKGEFEESILFIKKAMNYTKNKVGLKEFVKTTKSFSSPPHNLYTAIDTLFSI